jgi:hypothetical protein
MIVARYFSTIRHQIPPSARIGLLGLLCPELLRLFQSTTTEFERPSWLAHWGINPNYPLKSLAKSIASVSLQQRVKRSGETPSFSGYGSEARQLLSRPRVVTLDSPIRSAHNAEKNENCLGPGRMTASCRNRSFKKVILALTLVNMPASGWLTSWAIDAANSPIVVTRLT